MTRRHYQHNYQGRLGAFGATKEIQERKGNTALQTKTVDQFRVATWSPDSNVYSPSSDVEVPQKSRNDEEPILVGARAEKASLAAYISRETQQLSGVQKNATTIRKSLSKYCPELSSNIESGFKGSYRLILKPALGNIQSHQQGIKGSVKEPPAALEHICKTLKLS